jgi:hypothetical protein
MEFELIETIPELKQLPLPVTVAVNETTLPCLKRLVWNVLPVPYAVPPGPVRLQLMFDNVPFELDEKVN